jgi:hypothetical protein
MDFQGAPYILACCATIPRSRLKAAGIISGLYPVLFGLKGMLMEPRMLLWLAPWATGPVEKVLDWGIASAASGDSGAENLEKLLDESMYSRPGPDRRAWDENNGGLREILVASVRDAFLHGDARGAAWEVRLFGSHWGFDREHVKMGEGELPQSHEFTLSQISLQCSHVLSSSGNPFHFSRNQTFFHLASGVSTSHLPASALPRRDDGLPSDRYFQIQGQRIVHVHVMSSLSISVE